MDFADSGWNLVDKVLRITWPGGKASGERKLHTEEFNHLYCSPDVSRISNQGIWDGEIRNAHKIQSSERYIFLPLARSWRTWDNHFKTDL